MSGGLVWSPTMTKNNNNASSAAPLPMQQDPEKGKASPTCNKPVDEIAEIFSTRRKHKKIRKEEEEKAQKTKQDLATLAKKTKRKKMKMKRDERGSMDDDAPSRPRRRTNDGLTVYTEEELGIGKEDAGGTSLCPFDCNCCF